MYRPALTAAAAAAVAVATGCGSSSDGLASVARDVTLTRLGAQQAFSEQTPIACSKKSSSGSARTYVCRGAIVSAAGLRRDVAVTVVCDTDRGTCIP